MLENLFIVGCPRSGTTLVQAILNRHPAIVVPPETKLFLNFHAQSASMQRKCLSRLAVDWGIPERQAFELVGQSTQHAWERLKSIYAEKFDLKDCRIVGEKTPEHTSHLQTIRTLFPDAPIIAVVRNGFDVADSLTRVPWIRCNLASGAAIWSHYMHFITQAIDQQLPKLLVIRFEELVSKPESTLGHILRFLSVDESVVNDCLRPSPILDSRLHPPREHSWKWTAKQDVDLSKASSGHSLSIEQRQQVTFAARAMLLRWSYDDPSLPSLSFNRRLKLQTGYYVSVAHTALKLPKRLVFEELRRRCSPINFLQRCEMQ